MVALADVFFDPPVFAETMLRVLDKDKKLVPLRFNKAQRHFLAHQTGMDIIVKARQLGFSTFIQAEQFRHVTTGTATTLTLTHLDTTTQALRRMADRFYENIPAYFPRPSRKYSNSTIATYPDFNSEAIIATAGSVQTGRGMTFTHIHASEVAFWKDAELILAGAMQAGHPRIVMETTPNGAQGFLYETAMEALSGKSKWTLHFYPWWWDDRYSIPLEPGETLQYTEDEQRLADKHKLTPAQIKWRRDKQRELPHTFIQEYPEDPVTCFLNSGNTVFGAFENHLYTPEPGDTYNPEHRYFGGVDWGQANDYTAVSIKDATDNREVALLRINQMQWGDMRREIVRLCQQWHVEKLVVELNSASSNFENLRDELEAAGLDISTQGVHMTNSFKSELVVNLYEAVHTDGYRLIDDPAATADMRGFISKQTATGVWQYETPSPGHDDTVIARMLANYAAFNRIPDSW